MKTTHVDVVISVRLAHSIRKGSNMRKGDYTALRELVGKRFGTRVVMDAKFHDIRGDALAYMVCDCGRHRWSTLAPVLKGAGCASCNAQKRTHGLAHTAEARIWKGMIRRCNDETSHRYGGRGISVCERWRDSLLAFIEDMGPRPSDTHSLDRIDNDGNYCPENCRWATRHEQARNKSTNVIMECDGLVMSMAEWADLTGIPATTIATRIQKQWTFEEAVKIPKSLQYRNAIREAGTIAEIPIARYGKMDKQHPPQGGPAF
jgi:hypothetical protein